jgi:excisionase family DNA binding protein
VAMNEDRLMTAAEVADELLGVTARIVGDMARRGDLPHVRIGKYVRFRREAIVAWVLEQEVPRRGASGRRSS